MDTHTIILYRENAAFDTNPRTDRYERYVEVEVRKWKDVDGFADIIMDVTFWSPEEGEKRQIEAFLIRQHDQADVLRRAIARFDTLFVQQRGLARDKKDLLESTPQEWTP